MIVRLMCRRSVGVWIFLLFVLARADADESSRVGVVDLQQAFQRSPLVLALSAQLKARFDGRQQELKRRVGRIAALRNDLQSASPELRPKIEEQVRNEDRGLQTAQEDYRRDLEAAQKKQGEELIEAVREVAVRVAKDKGLSLLVKKDGVLYDGRQPEAPVVDITEDVIRALLRKAQAPASPRGN